MAPKKGAAPDAVDAAVEGQRVVGKQPSSPKSKASSSSAVLAEHAAQIRALGKRVVDEVIEIGRRLSQCRAILKDDHGWRAWLTSDLGWSHQTAGRFIQVYELAQRRSNLDHLDVPVSALYLLAAPSTPAEARDDVLDRAANGERLSHAQVKAAVASARPARKPPPVAMPGDIGPMLPDAPALEQEPDDTPEECWQRSVAHFAGDAISMRAFWTREFGAWEKFNAPSDVLTLIEQAATAWATLARDLSAANDLEIPMFLRRPNPEGAS